jgi:hypothetical protein
LAIRQANKDPQPEVIMVSAYAAIVLAVIFLSILLLLHFLKPELDPTWRMISEYEIGCPGWLMRLAFFSWGASELAILITIWPTNKFVRDTEYLPRLPASPWKQPGFFYSPVISSIELHRPSSAQGDSSATNLFLPNLGMNGSLPFWRNDDG